MEARGSGSVRLRPRRNPLADLTNASSLLSSAVKPNPKPKVSQEHSSTRSSVSSAGSSDTKNRGDHEPTKSTVSAKGSSSILVSGVGSNKKNVVVSSKRTGQSTVKLQYVEEKQKEKEKDASDRAALSCLPLGRTLTIWNNSMKKRGMNVQNKAYSDPYQKKKKKRRCVGSAGSKFSDEDIPLQNFIEKQRAYFKEVDKFELSEEVVSESELE